TPDPDTGIGRWRAADIERALRWGIARDDSDYLPVFPFPFYNRLTQNDLLDLMAFLGGLSAEFQVNRAATLSIFSTARTKAAVAILAEPFTGPWRPDAAKDAVWNRGAYLVNVVGRCGDCHTPPNWLGARDSGRFLAGTRTGPGGKPVPNITPDQESGIG